VSTVGGLISRLQPAAAVKAKGRISERPVINIEALCAEPPEALAHSPSQMPLSCLAAPLSQRELHKDGGSSGGGEWRGEEGARRPGPEGQFLHHVLRHALRNALRNVLRRVLDVLVLHVPPKESVGGGER